MAPSKKVKASFTGIQKHIDNLAAMNIPSAISILYRGKTHHFGSKLTIEFLKARPEITSELEKDALALCKGERDARVPYSDLNGEANAANTDLKLPAPIELLNRKETITVLRNLIIYDRQETDDNYDRTRSELWLKYGDESWQPSFWPTRLWNWSKMRNFCRLTVKDLEDAGLAGRFATLVDFFKYVITIGFEQLNLDQNDFLVETYDVAEERKRKKKRHIKTAPTTKSPEIDNPEN